MIVLKTLLSFRDNQEKKQRLVGETFEVTEKRFNQIIEVLPGYVEVVEILDFPNLEVIEPIIVKEKSKGRPKTKKA